MNQGTTEVLLAMNLSDRMVGTAYLDDEIWPALAKSYATIPVLSETYPDIDTLMSVQPDFLFASYSSAFRLGESLNYTRHIGNCSLSIHALDSDGTNQTDWFCRKELHDFGIQTYLQSPYCETKEHRRPASMESLFAEIWDIANIFNAHDQARRLIDSVQDHLEQAREVAAYGKTLNSAPIRVLWLDSWDDETPFVGACCGSVNLILEHAGAVNVFDDLGVEDVKSWDSVSWTDVAEQDPDFIVLVDAAWDRADEKLSKLCQHPITRELRAVQNRALLSVPFSASTLGVRVGALSYHLAEAFVALARQIPLSHVDFSMVTMNNANTTSGNEEVVAQSGVRVYTRFPVWNETDLETMCPGTSNVRIGDSPRIKVTENMRSSSSTIPSWSIVLMAILGIAFLLVTGGVTLLVVRERKGNPYFTPMRNEKATLG
jgi:iron complex transport system substrate-binding protein